MMTYIILAILVVLGGYIVGRETLAVQEALRRGEDSAVPLARFRRRLKGIALLIILYLLVAFFERLMEWGSFGARDLVLYFGGCIILMMWILLLATRDLRETANAALVQGQQLTAESFESIQKEILIRRKDHQRIPLAKEKSRPTPGSK